MKVPVRPPSGVTNVETLTYRVAAFVGTLALGAMAFAVLANVALRVAFGEPLLGVNEISGRWLLVITVFAGIVLALRRGDHVAVGVFTENLGDVASRRQKVWQYLTAVLFVGGVAYYGLQNALTAMGRGEFGNDSGWPLWPARFAVPVFAGLFVIILLITVTRAAAVHVSPDREKGGVGSTWATVVFVACSIILSAALLLGDFTRSYSAWLAVALALSLLMSGVYVGVAMGLAAVAGLLAIQGSRGLESALATVPYDSSSSWSLTVIPMFVVMGMLLGASGATRALFEAAHKWIGWLPGGLAVTTNATGAALGAASGSTMAITHAVGRVGIPAMLRAGYPKRMALASVMMSGSTSQLVPPSILLVLYAGIAGTSVGAQLLSGIVPGLALALLFSVLLIVMAMFAKDKVTAPKASWGERFAALKDVWAIPILILAVVGGIYFGIFTATEAGAMGAFVAALLAVQRLKGRGGIALIRAGSDTVAAVGSIFLLLIGAALLSRLLAFSGVTRDLIGIVEAWNLGVVELLFAVLVLYIILGMFMEPLSMMLLSVPILLPIVEAVGVDPIWFGVFVVLLGELAQVTPPVGLVLYVVQGLCRDPEVSLGNVVSSKDVMIASLWFVPAAIVIAALLIFFPDVVHWFAPA